MKTKSKRIIIACGAALLLVLIVVLFKRKGNREIVHQYITPSIGTIETFVSVTGTVLPKNRLEIKPSVNGRIEKIFVEEGDHVRKGQILALMSSTERSALLDAAKIDGDSSLQYWEKVYQPIPLVSPLAGEVIVRAVEPGQTVVTTSAVLVISDRLIVQADVDETDIGRVNLKQEANLKLEAHPEVQVKGRVTHISYESKTVNNVTIYEVEIKPDTIPGIFRSGMTADIKIIDHLKKDILMIPLNTTTIDSGKYYVKVYNQKNGEHEQKEFAAGISDDVNVEILSGLSANDRVMVSTPEKMLPLDTTKSVNPFLPSKRKGK